MPFLSRCTYPNHKHVIRDEIDPHKGSNEMAHLRHCLMHYIHPALLGEDIKQTHKGLQNNIMSKAKKYQKDIHGNFCLRNTEVFHC